jgi:hypothetical protein
LLPKFGSRFGVSRLNCLVTSLATSSVAAARQRISPPADCHGQPNQPHAMLSAEDGSDAMTSVQQPQTPLGITKE